MADEKISQLAALAAPDDADLIPVVDVSAGAAGSKATTVAEMRTTIGISAAERTKLNGIAAGAAAVGAGVVEVGAVNDDGASASSARVDHVHKHGDQAGGTLHAVATTAASGFMSATDKDLLFEQRQSTLYVEDFFVGLNNTPFSTSVTGTGATNAQIASEASHPGILQSTTGTTTTGRATFHTPTITGAILFGADAKVLEMLVRIPDLADGVEDFDYQVGWANNINVLDSNGIYFSYRRAARGANWHAVCFSGTGTFTDTTIAVAANTWVRLRIEINAAGTSVAFYIDGVLRATITTTIPASLAAVVSNITKSAGTTARVVQTDFIAWRDTFTVSR